MFQAREGLGARRDRAASCTDNTSPYARMRTFFSLLVTLRTFHPMHTHCSSRCLIDSVSLSNHPIRAPCHSWVFLSSLVFSPVLSSSTTHPRPLTAIRLNPCPTPLWGGPSGHLADPTPHTGYEPKFCIGASSEHTPINLPFKKEQLQPGE